MGDIISSFPAFLSLRLLFLKFSFLQVELDKMPGFMHSVTLIELAGIAVCRSHAKGAIG